MCRVDIWSGAGLLGGTSPNAHSLAGHFIEAAWRVLRRGLLECYGVASWVSGRDAEMELEVQDVYEDP